MAIPIAITLVLGTEKLEKMPAQRVLLNPINKEHKSNVLPKDY
jgi:hypothetical protein